MIHKISKYLLTLVALFAMNTGAWAQTQITQDFENGLGDWTKANCHSNSGVTGSYFHTHSGTNMFRFYYSANIPQYLISPEIDAAGGGTMSFYYARYSSSYAESFKVGYSTTTNEPTAFTWGDEVTCTNTYDNNVFLEYTYDIPAGAKYVAIACTSNDQFYLFVDDITIDLLEDPINVKVTTNVEEGDTCFTEAWFNMPVSDVTVDYELVRDMEYKVNAYVGDDAEVTYRHRVEKVSENLYKPVNITDDAQIIALFNVIDTIDAASPKTLVYGTDFTVTIVDEDQNETVPAEFNFAPGIYTVKVTGIGDYDGLIDSRNQFKLYYGYELKVAPGNYATYYKDEPLTTADENAELYTIASINGSKAVLSEQMQSVPKNTPFLIYNNHQTDTVTFVLFPVEGGQLSLIQYAPEFKGTLNDSIMPASSEGTKYYICNGYDFVWVRNAGTIAANRCWLEISNSNARMVNIVFDDEATSIKNLTPTLSEGEGAWYDLNGRKLNGMPTRKGVYILNGKKTVIK